MKFFKESDFNQETPNYLTRQMSADMANAKLEREGRDIQIRYLNESKKEWYASSGVVDPTHKALLICIESIESCKHPWQKVESYYAKPCDPESKYFKCECGTRVQPESFKEVK